MTTDTLKQRPSGVTFRETVRPSDIEDVSALVRSTGFFTDTETAVAVELVETALAEPASSGYHFIFAERAGGGVLGYTCFGPAPMTRGTFDLYWVVVHPDSQRSRIGSTLVAKAEDRIRSMGGRRVFVETSSRGQYHPTRLFYERSGYSPAAFLEDYYTEGDGKVIYVKRL